LNLTQIHGIEMKTVRRCSWGKNDFATAMASGWAV